MGRRAVQVALFAAGVGCAASVCGASPVPPDRGDLAAAYIRIDRLAQHLPRTPEVRSALNRAFDGLTADFFAGRYALALDALLSIESVQRELQPEARAELAYVAGHRFELAPRAVSLGRNGGALLHMSARLLDGMEDGSQPVQAVLLAGATRVTQPYQREMSFELPAGMAQGPIDLSLVFEHLGAVRVARACAIEGEFASRVEAVRLRMERLAAAETRAGSEWATLQARVALLSNVSDRSRTASLLLDIPSTLAAVEREIAQIETGAHPYAVRGELWRVYKALGLELPTRQFIPEGAGPFPLVIALHGAGGDENMFFDGYGDGELAKLAHARGFALVCPPTVPFGVSPTLLERFVDEVAVDAPIDRSRVLLLGHSLGAMAASRMATGTRARVAGAACVAGFVDSSDARVAAPRWVCVAGLDPIVPAAGVRAAVESARARGLDVQLVEFPDEGHTLVMAEALPQAVGWLLARPALTSDTTKPTPSAPSTSPMKTDGPAPAAIESNPNAGPRQ